MLSSAVPNPGFIDCTETPAFAALTAQFHALERLKEQARKASEWGKQAQNDLETFLGGKDRRKAEALGTLSVEDAAELNERRVRYAYHEYNLWAMQKPLTQAVKDMLKALNDASRQGYTLGSPYYCIMLFNVDAGAQLLLEAAQYLDSGLPMLLDVVVVAAVEKKYDSGKILYKIVETATALMANLGWRMHEGLSVSLLFHPVLRCLQCILGSPAGLLSGKTLAIPFPLVRKFRSDMRQITGPVATYLQKHDWQAVSVDDHIDLTWGAK